MNELEQVWRERIDGVQASGLTVAEASAQHGVSVASVHRMCLCIALTNLGGLPIANAISVSDAVASATADRAIKV